MPISSIGPVLYKISLANACSNLFMLTFSKLSLFLQASCTTSITEESATVCSTTLEVSINVIVSRLYSLFTTILLKIGSIRPISRSSPPAITSPTNTNIIAKLSILLIIFIPPNYSKINLSTFFESLL
ncbi:hypothetical protein COSY_0245 [Candidatus Vesicomyidisocius calyptogenae]|uniref:Uncharacterized protein n=1 Tax=Vesicomyosocius okutanii subsp. Calyptogena okutanii (strain HA) TaxID=412965 RepID=A5CXD5_VESOH|nr:hypothetical protein COSY_0245 [Candidatus Vesicomyosocius okutanii]